MNRQHQRNKNGKGAHSSTIKEANMRRVLAALRQLEHASIADIAEASKILSNTVWRLIEDLQRQGLVIEDGTRSGGRGVPAVLYRLNPSGAFSLGHFVGRDRIETAIMDFAGVVRAACSQRVEYPLPEMTVSILESQRKEVLASLPSDLQVEYSERLVGVGLAIPNRLGGWNRELVVPQEAQEWDYFDLAASLSKDIGRQVIVQNDGTAAATGELFQGVGRKLSSFLYLFVGPSTGGGCVANGVSLKGSTGTAGDFGLMPVPLSNLPSATPATHSYQILTATASLSALVRLLRYEGLDVNFDTLENALAERPDLEDLWIADALNGIVPILLTSICLVDPDAIVIGGNAPDHLLNRLRHEIDAGLNGSAPEGRSIPPIIAGYVGGNAPVYGAASMPLHTAFSPFTI